MQAKAMINDRKEPKLFLYDFLSLPQRRALGDQILKVDDAIKAELLDECSVIIQGCRELARDEISKRPPSDIREGLDDISKACSGMRRAITHMGATSYELINGRMDEGDELSDFLSTLSADLQRLQALSDEASRCVGEDVGEGKRANAQADFFVEQMLNAFWLAMGRYPSARGRDAWFVGLVQAASVLVSASWCVGEEKIERLAKSRADYDLNGHLAAMSFALTESEVCDCLSRTNEENWKHIKTIKSRATAHKS